MKPQIDHVKTIDDSLAGNRVRVIRTGKNISIRRLAHELKISAAFLCDLELGRRSWTVERFEQAIKTLEAL